VVVVNDGGGSVAVEVEAAGELGLHVQAIDLTTRQGLAVARNTGIEHSTGSFLAFLDDDDVFLPDHLRTALDVLNSSGADLAYADCLVSPRRVNPSGPVAAPLAFDFPFDPELLDVANIIPVHSAVLRSVRDLSARFDPDLPALEDWDLWQRLAREHGYRFRHVPRHTVVYHRIPAQASMTGQTTAEAAALAGFGDLLRRLWRRWPATTGKTARFRSWVGIMYWHAFAEFAQGRRPDFNYYLRSLHEIADAWTGRVPEGELIERLAQVVTEKEENVDVAAA
ncbi:MAG: glycosyltransferase family 2 protein, partial [Pseudonocardiaceae bacterium]